MVDLIGRGHSERVASKQLAGRRWETLRADYRRTKKLGELPKPSWHIDRQTEALDEVFDEYAATRENAERELPSAEQEARALEVDLTKDLSFLINTLVHERVAIEEFLATPAREQMLSFAHRGILDREEAKRRLAEMHKIRDHLERQIEAARKVDRLRREARAGT
jgi:hypothetical protein